MQLVVSGVNTFQFAMQLRLFRHFVPVSVVLLVSSDALMITGAFYQLLSASEIGSPIVLGASGFTAQFSAGLSFAAVTAMVSVGLYGQPSFLDFRLLLSKIAVASLLVLMLISLSATYWREGLDQLPDFANFPLKATLIWLVCVSVTRGTFWVTLGRGLLTRRILVLGNGTQAARIQSWSIPGKMNILCRSPLSKRQAKARICGPTLSTGAWPSLMNSWNWGVVLGRAKLWLQLMTDATCPSANCCIASLPE